MVRIIEIDQQINTPKARALGTIHTAGWANESDGDVEAPTGFFALVTIEPSELRDLVEAVFEDDQVLVDQATAIKPGAYILIEDNDGNSTLIEYASPRSARAQYDEFADRYNDWLNDGGMEP